jgi:hypothetical protein
MNKIQFALLWESSRQKTSASFVHYLLSWSIFVSCQQFCFSSFISCFFASLWISMQQTFTFVALDYTKVYVLLGDSKACLSRKNSAISCFLFFRHSVQGKALGSLSITNKCRPDSDNALIQGPHLE